jgi:multidrug efflux pump subunit AcrA (membrane-fusion protein)
MPKKFLVLLATIALSSSPVFAADDQQKEAAEDSNKWYKVQASGAAVTISLGGSVIPYKEVTLAAQLPGRVNTIAGIEGDAFRKEDLLITLDDRELLAQRSAAVAQLATANSEIQNAQVQYSRELWSPRSRQAMGGMGMPNLFDQMFSRPLGDAFGDTDSDAERHADLYSSGTRIQQAQNSALRAEAEIRAIDSKLRDARSVAPFDGVITKKFVEVGDTVQPGQPMLQFANIDYLQAVVDVPSRIAPGLEEGDMLNAEFELVDKDVPVRVAQVFPMADTVRHTVTVKFDIPQGISRPGAYVKVKIPDNTVRSRGIVRIPASAVQYRGSLPGVYVKGPDGEEQLRLVRIGETSGDMVTILSGLQVGDEILREPPIR